MNIEDTLSSLKKKIDAINTKHIENETRLHALEEEKLKLVQECQALGVDPTQLEQVLQIEEIRVNAEIAKIADEVNNVYGQLEKF